MSTDSKPQTLAGISPPETHLDIELETGGASNHSADPERCEWYCRECHARVTVSSTSHKEYGHATDCKYHLNVGSSS